MRLVIDKLCKRYGDKSVFNQVSLQVQAGEFVAIRGESGVGKSTLLNCMAGLDRWDSGSVTLNGQDLGALDETALAGLRRKDIGFVFQAVGLDGLGARLPQTLSGGQLQRVAIARALVHRPGLLLADEPTGNLDPSTAAVVMDALRTQCRAHGAALVLVTHSDAAARDADRVLQLGQNGISTL